MNYDAGRTTIHSKLNMKRIIGQDAVLEFLASKSISRAAFAGALALPFVALGYVVVFGYGTDGLVPSGAVAVFLTLIGALTAGSFAAGYIVSAIVAGLTVLALGPLWFLPPDPPLGTSTAADATTPMLAVLLFAVGVTVIEYGIRNREVVVDWFTPRTIAVGLASGSIHTVAVFWASAFVRQESVLGQFAFLDLSVVIDPIIVIVTLYAVLGLSLVGAVPAIALYRLHLVTPLIALGVLFGWTYWSAWHSLETYRETGGAAASISPEMDGIYTFLWMVPLAAICAVGLLEYGLRSIFNRTVG